jgi:hypothetical protein
MSGAAQNSLEGPHMHRLPVFITALLGLTIATAVTPQAKAQDKPPDPAVAAKLPGGTWASIAKLPDFVGVWEEGLGGGGRGRGRGRGARPQGPVLTPKYEAMYKAYLAHPPEDTSAANCVPPGMPGIMGQPYPIEFLFTPGKVTILIEAYMQIRHVYTDGRKHPSDPDLTFNGNSIGHWEGDTLVVDSVGFTPATPLGIGMKHSDKMHIVERMHLTDPDTMVITTTIDDPEALAQPWTHTNTLYRHRDWTLDEYICQQNNRNSVDASGKADINLSHK